MEHVVAAVLPRASLQPARPVDRAGRRAGRALNGGSGDDARILNARDGRRCKRIPARRSSKLAREPARRQAHRQTAAPAASESGSRCIITSYEQAGIHPEAHDGARGSAIGRGRGRDVSVMALAVRGRATRETEARDGKTMLPCIVGTPLPASVAPGTSGLTDASEAAIFSRRPCPLDPQRRTRERHRSQGNVPALPPRRGCAQRPRTEKFRPRLAILIAPGPRLSHRRLARMSENREPRVFAPYDPNILLARPELRTARQSSNSSRRRHRRRPAGQAHRRHIHFRGHGTGRLGAQREFCTICIRGARSQ